MSHKFIKDLSEEVKKTIFGYRVQINTMGGCCFVLQGNVLARMTQLDVTCQFPDTINNMEPIVDLFGSIQVRPLENLQYHGSTIEIGKELFTRARDTFRRMDSRLDDAVIFTNYKTGMSITVSPVIRCPQPRIYDVIVCNDEA